MSTARLNHTKKSRKEVTCQRCGKVLPVGSEYYYWKFRIGGIRIRCAEHKPEHWERESNPKRQSMIQASDALANAQTADSAEEAAGYLTEARDHVESVRDALQDAVDAWASTNLEFSQRYQDYEESIDDLENWISDVEEACSDLDAWEPEEQDDDDEDALEDESWREYVENLDDVPDVEF